jgi:hypothetical protein
MLRHATEFGLTVSARSRLAAGTNAPPPCSGKFAGLLGSRHFFGLASGENDFSGYVDPSIT